LGFKHCKQIPAGLPVYIVRIQTLTEDKLIVTCRPSYEKHKIAVEMLKWWVVGSWQLAVGSWQPGRST